MNAYDAAINNAAEFAMLAQELAEFKNGTDYDQHWGAAFDKRCEALSIAMNVTRFQLINELWVCATTK